jgi:hypothetical protein
MTLVSNQDVQLANCALGLRMYEYWLGHATKYLAK